MLMYNKIFTKILDSSIWLEPTPTRLLWMTLIAAMDEDGYAAFASIGNLAHRARLTMEETTEAVKCLEAPDKESSDPDNEGRRIERVPGGWMILNAKKYRELVTRTVIKEQNRIRVARHREKKRPVTKRNAKVTRGNESVMQSDTATHTATDSKEGEHSAVAESSVENPKSEHQQFIEEWETYYGLRTGGQKYNFRAVDGKAVKTLLTHFGGKEPAKAFIKACHARHREGYPFGATETLPDLANGISRLQAALSTPPKRNGNSHPSATAPIHGDPNEKL